MKQLKIRSFPFATLLAIFSPLVTHGACKPHLVTGEQFLANFKNLEGQDQYHEFIRTVRSDKSIRSVDDAVEILPSIFRHNYAVVHRSGNRRIETTSLADWETGDIRPRIVSSNHSGSFQVAYNSGFSSTGNVLEGQYWDNTAMEFKFFELRFARFSDKTNSQTASMADRFDDKVDLNNCMACHSQALHPLWGSWHEYHGVVGETGAEIPDLTDAVGRYAPQHEYDYYTRFMETKSAEKRFSVLIPKPALAGDPDRKNLISNFLFSAFWGQLTAVMLAKRVADGVYPSVDEIPTKERCVSKRLSDCLQRGKKKTYYLGVNFLRQPSEADMLRVLRNPDQTFTTGQGEEEHPDFKRFLTAPGARESIALVVKMFLLAGGGAPPPY